MIVVEHQAHAAEHDDIRVRLRADPRQQLVVGLAGDGEDRDLLALDQAVEQVDHRHVGADHLRREDAAHRVHRRAADRDGRILRQVGAAVDRIPGAAEYAPEYVR